MCVCDSSNFLSPDTRKRGRNISVPTAQQDLVMLRLLLAQCLSLSQEPRPVRQLQTNCPLCHISGRVKAASRAML